MATSFSSFGPKHNIKTKIMGWNNPVRSSFDVYKQFFMFCEYKDGWVPTPGTETGLIWRLAATCQMYGFGHVTFTDWTLMALWRHFQ